LILIGILVPVPGAAVELIVDLAGGLPKKKYLAVNYRQFGSAFITTRYQSHPRRESAS
jgi:hypothetical protein